MALTLKEFRQKYPQYDNVSDQKLAEGLHRRYYSSVPFDEFAAKIEYRAETAPPPPEPTIQPEVTRNPLKGAVARGAELLGSGIETLGRAGEAIGDVIAEKAPILDTRLMIDREGVRLERPTKEDIRDKNQLQYMQDWADSFRNWGREINYEPSTKLGELADNPLNAVPFIVERVITSSPDMVAAAAALPAYIPTRANEILNERLKNDDRLLSEATIGDVAAATSAAVVEATLERFATRRLVGEGAEAATTLGRVGKEAAVQAGTEATEEVAAYAGETAGTKAGFDPRTAGLTALEAAIVGGGLGAGAQGVREIFGAGPSEAEPEVTEEVAPPEEAAPVRRPRPAVPAELGAALEGLETTELPPEVIEGVPPAVVDSAKDILSLVDEGKAINLFRARSLARQLGADIPQNANKETTLTALREAVALVAAPSPVQAAEETVATEAPSAAPEAVKPVRINPFLPLEEQGFAVPEAAQVAPIEAGEEIAVPEAAQMDVLAGKEIRPPTDDIYEVAEANFNYPRMIGNQTVPIEQLEGGVTAQAGERKRVDELANQIASDEGYFSRVIVDQNNNVIEGQHRLEALRQLGAKEVPVFKIEDMGDTFPVMKMEAAVLKAQPMREEQASQIVKRALNAVAETGGVQEAAKLQIPGFQKGYAAALNVIEPVAPTVEVPSEPTRAGVSEVDLGAGARGVELPVSRVGAAGPEVTEPPVAGLERVGAATERPIPGAEAPAPTLETPAPTRIFESIEGLNRPLPPVTEQLARDRAPSLRRELGKAVKQFDTGEMSGAELANRASMLLLQTQKEQIVRPRVRGAEFIRERLFNASRNGYLDPQGVEIASWFVQQNPLLVQDLGVSVQQQPEKMAGSAAFYNPVNRIITLFKDKGDEQTATHEILHHTERLMPAEIRAGILKAYVKQLTKAIKSSKSPDEKIALQRLLEHHLSGSDSLIYDSVIRAFKSGTLSPDKYQFVNPSEFWAVNGSRIVQGRYNLPPGVVGQIRKWLREFIQKAKDVFGLKSDAAIIRALDSLAKADGKYQTEQLLAEAPAYRAVEPPPKNLFDVRKRSTQKAKGPSVFQRAMNQFEGHGFYQNLVKKFADITEPIMALDRAKERAEYLITMGPDRNDIASELVRSPNITDFIITRRVEPAERELQNAIKDYARAAGMSVEDAVNKLDSIMIAIHEAVRRETKYLRNVGLRNDIRLPAGSLPFAENQPAMTPADYREYLEGLRSKLPPDQAAQIQDVMRVIVDKFKTSRGFSPKAIPGKPTPLDINDKFYDVIPRKIDGKDAYTPAFLSKARSDYNKLSGKQKAAIDKVRAALAKINEIERELSSEANYWSPQVDSVVASYQWGDTYVPFQGIPDADDSLDFNSKKLSGELTETAQAWDGRSTDFDSPILQSVYNAKRAAGRVGRKDLINVTLVNNIKQGFLRAKSVDPEVYTFDDRRAPDFDFSVLEGANKVLVYQPNGDVHVYELKEKDKIDALKLAYRKLKPGMQEALDKVGKVTSWFAQYHTRFNIAFPPMDFFTNTMTNFGFISAGKGGIKEGARYTAQTLSNVARSGLFTKAGNLSRALSSKNPVVLEKLVQSKDPFYSEAMDFIRLGGRSLYRQALGVGVQLDELVNAVGPGLIMKTGKQVARLFDIYNDMFELTSRLAAYTTHLKDITARAKLKGIDVNNPEVQEALKREATTFALELMNFRKAGEYGRILSSLYMFFKPGATSAKLAYNAVRKLLISADSELKNTDPAVWARLNSVYETQELDEERAKPRPDQQKITELENAIQANNAAKQKFMDNYNLERKNALVAIPLFFATGAVYYTIAQMFAPDDDEGRNKIATDEMSRWTRYARMPIPGSKEFFQLPWGYGVGSFAAAGAQFAALKAGNLSVSDFTGNMIEIGLDSFMPFPASRVNPFDNVAVWAISTIAPSSVRGFIEYAFNMDSLGNPIYNSRLGKYADAYSGTARAGELHNKMADVLFGLSKGEINWNPNTIAYVMNTYADGLNVLAEGAFGLALALKDEKELDLKKDVPIFKRFIGRMSNFDAREFSEAERWIREKAPKYKAYRDIRSPEEYDEYVEKNPTVPIISAMYDNVLNGTLSTLSEQRKLILRNRELTPKERQESLDEIDYNINAVKRNFVESYKYIREEEDAGG
jgi:hypothetical protein